MKKNKFDITAEELEKGLGISLERLYEVVDFFDADSKDEWELKEGEHFAWLIKNAKTRTFSEFGAFAIAKYLDTTQPQNIWSRLKEFLFQYKAKLRKSFIRKQVLNHCDSLTVRNGQMYLSKTDSVGVLMTSHARINKAFEDLLASDSPLEKGIHFNDFEDKRFYSLRGFEKICHLLGQELTLKDRREWCKEVTVTGPEVMQKLMDAEMAFESKVEAAKRAVRKKDGNRCQATGQKTSPAQPMIVNVHHIFCRQHYPDIAASQDNLVTLNKVVHDNFHSWNGKVPCTADRLIEFLAIHHPEAENLTLRLHYTNKVYQRIKPKSLVAAK
ncbi:hypothetical protein [Chamaesiphon sp.]|uniref:hypothetical protein n=1 Tax=Chamaesiphon sp. TaxID=2814140 RepID=UPI0035948487